MKKALISVWTKVPILLILLTLSACGQRGPLYLPETPAEPPASEVSSEPEDDSDENG